MSLSITKIIALAVLAASMIGCNSTAQKSKTPQSPNLTLAERNKAWCKKHYSSASASHRDREKYKQICEGNDPFGRQRPVL